MVLVACFAVLCVFARKDTQRKDAEDRKAREDAGLLTAFSYHYSWKAASRLTLFPNGLAVHKHSLDTFRQELRLLEGRSIEHTLRIKNDKVRFHTFSNKPSVAQPQSLRRHRSHLANRLRKRKPVLLSSEAAEHFRERT